MALDVIVSKTVARKGGCPVDVAVCGMTGANADVDVDESTTTLFAP